MVKSSLGTPICTLRRIAPSRNENGQATLEYILLLLISVGVIASAILQANKDFAVYAKDLIGNYVICLLDNGELPTLGSDQASAQCAPPVFSTKAKVADKDPAAPGGGGGGSGSSGGGSGSSSAGSTNGQKDSRSKTSSSESRAADTGRGGRGRGVNRGGVDSFGNTGRSTRTRVAANPAEPESTSATGKLVPSNSSGRGFRELKPSTERGGRVIASFTISEEQQDRENGKRLSLGARSDVERKQSRMRIEPSVKKKSDQNDDDSAFSIGGVFRILLIVAILIVLIVFIGGQLFQAAKSFDKD